MAALGVWADDPRPIAQRYLPAATRSIRSGRAFALATDDVEVCSDWVRVGCAPTSSTISVTATGLCLARGPAWTAPIYYRDDDAVASSDLALLVRPDDEVDVRRLAAMVGFVNHPNEARSYYRSIRVVRPFETVVIAEHRRQTIRKPPDLKPLSHLSIDELASELRRRLVIAVDRAVGNRHVGVMLGGLDSSSLLAALLIIRGARPSDVHVTLDFDSPGSDRPHVRMLEDRYGVSVIRVRPSDVRALDSLMIDGAPSRTIGGSWFKTCAQRVAAAGVQVLVVGTGGDQIFGGRFDSGIRTSLLDQDLRGIWDVFSARFPHRMRWRTRVRATATAMLRPYAPRMLMRLHQMMRSKNSLPWVGPLLREEIARYQEQSLDIERSGRQQHFAMLAVDGMESNNAEVRAQHDTDIPIHRVEPIYDEDLVRFLTTIPPQALFAGGTFRGLLRHAMRGFLPDSVRERLDKSDFETASADAFGPFANSQQLLSFEVLDRAGVVDAQALRRYLLPLFADPRASANGPAWVALWLAISAEAFLRGHT